jgi:signal peptidase II
MLWGFEGLKKRRFYYAVTLIVTLFDFLTKRVIEAYVQPYDVIPVLPFLQIVNIKNTGAAFGMFAGVSNYIFIIISLIAIVFIFLYMIKTEKPLEKLSLSLILGGAAGNLIDRLTIGKVIDFIDIFVDSWHWPAFNVADAALTTGIILYLIANIFVKKYSKEHQ